METCRTCEHIDLRERWCAKYGRISDEYLDYLTRCVLYTKKGEDRSDHADDG